MNLSPMRFKDYVWPHNPRVYGISFERKVALHKIPFGRYMMQDLGMTCRVLKGEGEFVGEGAYAEFKKLASVFYSNGAGILVHPIWQTSKAYFVSLTVLQEPREDYVSYSFEFWEDNSNLYKPGLTEISRESDAETALTPEKRYTYTVASGDTLWGIAEKLNMKLDDMLALNPQIKNPNLIYPGDEIFYISGGSV